jgi:hypothetical protein
MKVRIFGIAVVALMAVSLLAGVAGIIYQAAAGQGNAPPAETALQGPLSAATEGRPGDNAAVSAFKLICPFH